MSGAPYFADIAQGPNGGHAEWLTTSDGVRVRVAHWTTDNAIGTILLFPGRTEYIEKYGRDAVSLTDRGFNVLTIDWRGQGIADRLLDNRMLGHVDRFTDYQRDVQAMVDYARRIKLPEPFFLIGHSMGGCIGLRALHNALPVCAAAFSAPMWGINLGAAIRPVAWAISSMARPLGINGTLAFGQSEDTYVAVNPFAGNNLTTDEDMYNYMRDQLRAQPDLALGGPTFGWLFQALNEMYKLRAMPAPDTPAIVLLGSDEKIVDSKCVRHVASKWPGQALVEYDGGLHEILMERPEIRTDAFDRIAEHFRAHAS
ncbi:lysophospholipase [Marivivens niveibacter]|uniref:Lysophospholipase n=1 Tax=Marivivens niveibacter TaxID=1930667 RepID=A0A251X1U9_9RHOB|nr:alpha/beta hydrolase [Marivivens niveibacter]OUD10385.1 lysophospholipase [Marivivens niveibacter]